MNYNREQIKELLLTDYLDGQLDDVTRQYIDSCLSKDPKLQSFLEAARKMADEPFRDAPDIKPPAHVWRNIREEIEFSKGEEKESFGDKIIAWVRGLVAQPKTSFAFGGFAFVCFIFVWMGISRVYISPIRYNSEQQVEYLMFLADGNIGEGEEEGRGGFETTIENYFL